MFVMCTRGMRIVFLPPYSPDCNPIEEGFSSMKAWIRRNGKAVRTALNSGVPGKAELCLTQAVYESMLPEKIVGWYHHSGYL